MSTLVSIVIPAFDAERWIGACIDSALAQRAVEVEVVVVDDGSRDRTLQVAERRAGPRVRVLSQANAGAAAARNAGLRAARGDCVQFLDADDLLHPHALGARLRDAAPGARSRTLLTGAWGRFFHHPSRAVFEPTALWRTQPPLDWLLAKFETNAFMVPAAWTAPRALLEAAGPWDERLSYDDDGEYLCRVVAAADAVRFAPDSLAWYRIGNPGSLSARLSPRALQSSVLSLGLCIDHLLALQDSPRTRAAALQLLQDNLPQVHPEHPALADALRQRARALGGELHAPPQPLRYRLASRVLGPAGARRVRRLAARLRLQARHAVEMLPRPSPMHLEGDVHVR
jgi:hypothetical protein